MVADLEVTKQGRTMLAFDGRELDFPPQAREAVEALFAEEGELSAAALPGSLDRAGRLVLVRRLVREGFLELVGCERAAAQDRYGA